MKRLLILFVLLLNHEAWAVDFDGTVQWSRKVALGPAVSGIVTKVDVDVGATVKKGDRLLALDPTPFRAHVTEARGALARANIARDEAARDLKQAKELYARTVLSTVELQNAQMKHDRAEAAVQEARAALDQAQYRLRVSEVRAPFDAVVLARDVQPGQAVAVNLEPPALITVAARGEYLAVAPVPAGNVAKLEIGRKIGVLIGGHRFEGTIKSVGLEPVANARETSYEVRVVFEAGDTAALRAGMSATLALP